MKAQLIILTLLFPYLAISQDEQEKTAILHTIHELFDGMRNSDSSKVNAVFHENVSMNSSFTHKTTGLPTVHNGNPKAFLEAIGTPKDKVWDERISNVSIQIDDNLGHAWMDYSFYLDNTFSHCGINSIRLVRENDSWKIIDIFDTRRTTNCTQ